MHEVRFQGRDVVAGGGGMSLTCYYEMDNAQDDLPYSLHLSATMKVTFDVINRGYKGDSHEPPHGPDIEIRSVEIECTELWTRDGDSCGLMTKHLHEHDRADILKRFDEHHRNSERLYEEMLAVAGVET